jgi:LPXTG-site transpeptidase (sortase) family protein
MVRRFYKSILITAIAVFSVTGLLTGLKEYTKSFIRESVKEEILEKKDAGDLVFEVPAGDYLSVEGEEGEPETDILDNWIGITGYVSGNDRACESLHLAGIIEIGALGIEEPIWEENTSLAMRYGVILMKNTARLEETGNAVIVGHRNTVTHTVFDKLTSIKKDDEVVITTPDGLMHNYRVNGTYYCSPYDLQNYVGTSSEYPVMITLVTCAREKGNSWRFIVTLVPD